MSEAYYGLVKQEQQIEKQHLKEVGLESVRRTNCLPLPKRKRCPQPRLMPMYLKEKEINTVTISNIRENLPPGSRRAVFHCLSRIGQPRCIPSSKGSSVPKLTPVIDHKCHYLNQNQSSRNGQFHHLGILELGSSRKNR